MQKSMVQVRHQRLNLCALRRLRPVFLLMMMSSRLCIMQHIRLLLLR